VFVVFIFPITRIACAARPSRWSVRYFNASRASFGSFVLQEILFQSFFSSTPARTNRRHALD